MGEVDEHLDEVLAAEEDAETADQDQDRLADAAPEDPALE
jgi:hypothetical protein